MADFVSVLKKQLDKKGDPSFEVRKQIYDGARSVLAKKLAEFRRKQTETVLKTEPLKL